MLPLFEAVVNAVQAVDAAHGDMDSARIEVRIIRDQQQVVFKIDGERRAGAGMGRITGFVITDNGVGFHDENMESFNTLDSEYKSDLGCRGVGRLLWLKAFDRVEVASRYVGADDAVHERTFNFTSRDGVSGERIRESPDSIPGTEIRLLHFADRYRERAPKTASPIAKDILEHCLWYFVRPSGAPHIAVVDGDERVDLQELFDDYMIDPSSRQEIIVKRKRFSLLHLRLKATSRTVPQLNWCAATRVVSVENLSGKVPGLHGRVKDGDSEFMYSCYLTSDYLDESVRSERTGFDIPETTDGALDEEAPSMSDIRAAVLAAVGEHLHAHLAESRKAGLERVQDYVDRKSPRYRPILHRIGEEKLGVDPGISDRELELYLHRQLADLEAEVIVEGRRVLDEEISADAEYNARVQEYLAKVSDIKKSDLADYVFHRRVILDLLNKAIRADDKGKYVKEEVVHRLIMPMRVTSDEVAPDACNLWLLDERLAFHNFLASDKPIKSMPITGSGSKLEPDLMALQLTDTPILVAEGERMPLAAITVVEIKRPMRDDMGAGPDKDPIEQALTYLERVREGRVKTASGRQIPQSDRIPGFCYIISDLTPTMEKRCKQVGLRKTQDGLGYFGYNANYEAYIEIFSFERLRNLATERNRAFFDRLGLPVD
ncbi:ATP-binding protein [Spirillospora sp. NPDC049652]